MNMKTIDMNMAIGDSVTECPGLTGVYMAYGVDFCCGGDRSIEEALKDSDTGSEIIMEALNNRLAKLESEGESTQKLSGLSNTQLVDNIIDTHHRYLRQVLPDLGMKLFKLIEVHGDNHPELFDIHQMVGHLRIELEAHLVKEEKQLFPLIVKGEAAGVVKLIKELEEEHDAAGDILKKLTVVTDHFKLPQDACRTYQVTFNQLQQLQEDMYQHVHKENNVLFKRFY